MKNGDPFTSEVVSQVFTLEGRTTIDGYRPPDPGFRRVAELLRSIQRSGAVGMKILRREDQQDTNEDI